MHTIGTVRYLSPAFLEPWDACLVRSAGSWARLDSSAAEVFREPSLFQPALISHGLQTLQGVSAESHKPLDLVAEKHWELLATHLEGCTLGRSTGPLCSDLFPLHNLSPSSKAKGLRTYVSPASSASLSVCLSASQFIC